MQVNETKAPWHREALSSGDERLVRTKKPYIYIVKNSSSSQHPVEKIEKLSETTKINKISEHDLHFKESDTEDSSYSVSVKSINIESQTSKVNPAASETIENPLKKRQKLQHYSLDNKKNQSSGFVRQKNNIASAKLKERTKNCQKNPPLTKSRLKNFAFNGSDSDSVDELLQGDFIEVSRSRQNQLI
ncbi:hypothetical protein BB560_001068 [Smittium megazygosporum]|uniref:Uncharacterized protein n=1 Tax=Smittium megazygosporum TaxID=133381 RepID=A0A2T9ZIM8_9FUNG|nr:hypothetical protein BB560_001068 [Smittium megazygosporum]